MEEPEYVFLKVGRDPDDPALYSVSHLLPCGKYVQDLGSYDKSRLFYELEELREAVLEGKVKVTGIKISKPLLGDEDRHVGNVSELIEILGLEAED